MHHMRLLIGGGNGDAPYRIGAIVFVPGVLYAAPHPAGL